MFLMMDDFSQFFSFFLPFFFMLRSIFFLSAVVVGIVVTGTEIRAQARLSAKAAAACEYLRAVVGCVDPSHCHRVLLMCPSPLLPPLLTTGQPQCRPLLPGHRCFPVTNAKPSLCLFVTLRTASVIHERRRLRHGSSAPRSITLTTRRVTLWPFSCSCVSISVFSPCGWFGSWCHLNTSEDFRGQDVLLFVRSSRSGRVLPCLCPCLCLC